MQEVKLFRLGENLINIKERPCVIVGEPCEELCELQKAGYCVLAELTYLQGLDEDAIAQALCEDEAVMTYQNVCIDAAELSEAYLRRIWCRHSGSPVLIGETQRLIIRESITEDAEAFWELYNEEAGRTYLEALPVASNDIVGYQQYIEAYQKGQYAFYEYGMWSIIDKATGACIGRAGLEYITLEEGLEGAALGYALLLEARGKGYAAEACIEILKYCQENNISNRVYVKIHRENSPSLALYQKLQSESIVDLVLVINKD